MWVSTWLGVEWKPLGIVQGTEILRYDQMVYAQPRIYLGKKRKKKRTCWIVDFAVLADHRVKVKGSEKRDKYLDLARELKKTMEHESDSGTNCNWCARYGQQSHRKYYSVGFCDSNW